MENHGRAFCSPHCHDEWRKGRYASSVQQSHHHPRDEPATVLSDGLHVEVREGHHGLVTGE